jgi:hypothetical protein
VHNGGAVGFDLLTLGQRLDRYANDLRRDVVAVVTEWDTGYREASGYHLVSPAVVPRARFPEETDSSKILILGFRAVRRETTVVRKRSPSF